MVFYMTNNELLDQIGFREEIHYDSQERKTKVVWILEQETAISLAENEIKALSVEELKNTIHYAVDGLIEELTTKLKALHGRINEI